MSCSPVIAMGSSIHLVGSRAKIEMCPIGLGKLGRDSRHEFEQTVHCRHHYKF